MSSRRRRVKTTARTTAAPKEGSRGERRAPAPAAAVAAPALDHTLLLRETAYQARNLRNTNLALAVLNAQADITNNGPAPLPLPEERAYPWRCLAHAFAQALASATMFSSPNEPRLQCEAYMALAAAARVGLALADVFDDDDGSTT